MEIKTHTKTYKKKHFIFSKGSIVFIHGYKSSWYIHREFLVTLYKSGYNIYAFDFPNHGKNEDFKDQLWFDDYVKFASEYIKREKIKRLIVMGHSMGGGVTQAIQKELGHKIKTTVLIDPLNKKAGSVDIGRVVSVAKDGNLFAKIKEWLSNDGGNPSCKPRELLGNLNSKETSATIEEGMKHISSPVLLMFGENDFIIPPKSSIEYIKENATNSALFYSTIIPGAKHSPMSENKEKTLEEILTFLEKNKKYIKK